MSAAGPRWGVYRLLRIKPASWPEQDEVRETVEALSPDHHRQTADEWGWSRAPSEKPTGGPMGVRRNARAIEGFTKPTPAKFCRHEEAAQRRAVTEESC